MLKFEHINLLTQNTMEILNPLLQSPKASPFKILFLLISLAALISSALLLSNHFLKDINFFSSPISPLLVQNICNKAHDQASCTFMLSQMGPDNNFDDDDRQHDLLLLFLRKSTPHMQTTIKIMNQTSRRINNPRDQMALNDCVELVNLSMDRVLDSILALQSSKTSGSSTNVEDVHSWLSSVLTNHVTCLDGVIEGSSTMLRSSMESKLNDLISRARTSLAIFVYVREKMSRSSESLSDRSRFLDGLTWGGVRSLSLPSVSFLTHNRHTIPVSPIKTEAGEPLEGEFPEWVSGGDRRILKAVGKDINANVVVAKDGSGKYKTVKEAVASAPDKSNIRYIIYVKKGTYKENIEVGKTKKNVMIIGDGMDSTIITGSLNVIDGATTFNSATLAAVGDGFIAQDIWIQNTAGPAKHQAVALRVGADQSVINRCRIDAYQDTLYAHSNRQFYRDSYITGTVDFIFGNAAVVFQNCKIVARKPMSNQANMVTAQGRIDPNQNTGTSIQKCDIIASSDLKPVKKSIKSYLGRPWKEYSRTVFMQSNIGDHIDPTGWAEWNGSFALKTLYYGEYANSGAGADVSKRVKWAGYHVIKNPAEAQKFTVSRLIQGEVWLKPTGVTYSEGL